MRFLRWRNLAGSIVLLTAACGGSSDEPVTRPEYEPLFDPLPAATPDVLRGVWGTTQTSDTGSANLRFRFADGKLTGGARCTFNVSGATALTTGQSTTFDEMTNLDGKTGKFTPTAALSFQTTGSDPGLKTSCTGSLPRAQYTYEIQSTTMTLTAPGAQPQILTKVGD